MSRNFKISGMHYFFCRGAPAFVVWMHAQFAKNNADCVIFLRFINFIFLYAQSAV